MSGEEPSAVNLTNEPGNSGNDNVVATNSDRILMSLDMSSEMFSGSASVSTKYKAVELKAERVSDQSTFVPEVDVTAVVHDSETSEPVTIVGCAIEMMGANDSAEHTTIELNDERVSDQSIFVPEFDMTAVVHDAESLEPNAMVGSAIETKCANDSTKYTAVELKDERVSDQSIFIPEVGISTVVHDPETSELIAMADSVIETMEVNSTILLVKQIVPEHQNDTGENHENGGQTENQFSSSVRRSMRRKAGKLASEGSGDTCDNALQTLSSSVRRGIIMSPRTHTNSGDDNINSGGPREYNRADRWRSCRNIRLSKLPIAANQRKANQHSLRDCPSTRGRRNQRPRKRSRSCISP